MCSSNSGNDPKEAKEALAMAIDLRSLELTGKDKIVLRCGKASITLLSSGKVIIRGTHIVSRSTGANRIRGGSVELN